MDCVGQLLLLRHIVWANYCCCVILCGPTTVVASYCVGQLLLLRHIVTPNYKMRLAINLSYWHREILIYGLSIKDHK